MTEDFKINYCSRDRDKQRFTCNAWSLLSECKYFDRTTSKWFDCKHRGFPCNCFSVEAIEDLKIVDKMEDI